MLYLYFLTVLLVISSPSVLGSDLKNAEQSEDLILWYTEPGNGWLESIPLGNGRIGAMVEGGVTRDRVILNESTLYSREFSIVDTLRDLTPHLDIISRMIANGEYSEADEYGRKYISGPTVPCYQPLGDIIFEFSDHDQYADYRRELDLSTAITTTTYQIGDIKFTREAFLSYPDNVLVMRLKSSESKALNFNISVESQHPTIKSARGSSTEFLFSGQVPGVVLRRSFSQVEDWEDEWKYPELWKDGERIADTTILYNGKGITFETNLKVLQCDGRLTINNDEIIIKEAREVVIAVAIATSFNGFYQDLTVNRSDLSKKNSDVISRINDKTYQELLQNHLVDYQELFDRVSLGFNGNPEKLKLSTDERKKDYSVENDPSFAALNFQYGRYLLIASSRADGQPANLQGIWNVDIIPPWSSAYTTNINLQMNYWPAEVTNLSECHEPLFKFIKELTVSGGRVAKEMYQLPGCVLHHNTSLWRSAHPIDNIPLYSFWPMAGGWLCQHLWNHYQYTLDLDFLENTAYPIMKGSAEFFNGWLKKDSNGYWVTPVSTSPENHFKYTDEFGQDKLAGLSMATTMDLAIIRELFHNVIQSEELLNIEDGCSEELLEKLSNLYPYQVNEQGELMEFYRVFKPSPPRHNTSPYYPVFPGNEFTMDKTPVLFEAAKKMILNRSVQRPNRGGWPSAWELALMARLNETGREPDLINALINRTHLNLLNGSRSVFQIDGNLGFTAAVAEMLLQSHEGKIHLLPALPDALPSGSVKGLKTVGNFEISIQWEEEKLVSSKIIAGNDSILRVMYNEKEKSFQLKKGEFIVLDGSLEVKF